MVLAVAPQTLNAKSAPCGCERAPEYAPHRKYSHFSRIEVAPNQALPIDVLVSQPPAALRGAQHPMATGAYHAVPPVGVAHDTPENAIALQNGVAHTNSSVGATGDYETNCGTVDSEDRLDVWHVYTAAHTGLASVTVESATVGFDTTLAVFDVAGTQLACNDDICYEQDNFDSRVNVLMFAGEEYLIRIAGCDYSTGTYTVTVVQEASPIPRTPEQPTPADGATNVDTNVTLAWNGATAPAALSAAASGIAKDHDIAAKGIYGHDDRMDEYEVSNPNWLAAGDATVMLVDRSLIRRNVDGTYSLDTHTLAEWHVALDPIGTGNPLCYDEPYRDQPAPGFCTGVLVSPDLIATAGHCISCENLSDIVVVFAFVMQDADTAVTRLSSADVYHCAEVVGHQDGLPDWSLIRLDRTVTNHTPTRLRRHGQVTYGDSLYTIGHPGGLPRKYAGGATVRDNVETTFFSTNVDAYEGNSGSPVFSVDAIVEGLLVRGGTDYVEDASGTCDRSIVCPDSGCIGAVRWEQVTRAELFSARIPAFDVYLGVDIEQLQLVDVDCVAPWYHAGSLQGNTTYYWQIVAHTCGRETAGPVWRFTTSGSPTTPGSPVYRFWSERHKRHFYTISESEKNKLISQYAGVWTFEGQVYRAFAVDSAGGLLPVHRFWSDRYNAHFYTISQTEKDKLVNRYSHVWRYEGPAFYAWPQGSQPPGTGAVHRFWSDSLGTHFYTISETEKSKLVNQYSYIWNYEGPAWYAYPPSP